MTPPIRGSSLRLPEPHAGRCPPDTNAFAQPSTSRAPGPIAYGPRTLPNRDVQLYGLTGRFSLFPSFSQPSSRAPAALQLAAILPRRRRLRPDRPDADRNTQYVTGRRTRTATPFGSISGGHACGFAPPLFEDRRSRRFGTAVGRVEPQGPSRTSLSRDRDDLPVTQTCT